MMKRSKTAFAVALRQSCWPRRADPKRETPPAAPEAPRVALVLKTLNSPFFIDMERGAQEAAQAAGREPHRPGRGA